jgi:malonyl-CoA O-methyltransferase
MNVVQEFSRFANQYDSYNSVQSQVATKLVSMIEQKKYNSVIDIGCGSGLIYKNMINSISFREFIALDFSMEMLDIHPYTKNIKKIHFDFNKQENFKQLGRYDIVVSSSALQWSRDLDTTLQGISNLSTKCYLSIFTSNTFSTLHKVANIKSPIYSEEYIKNSIKKYFDCSFETIKYHITFSSVHQMFQYIKRSGVSGGDRQLSYSKTKELIKNYPLNYLEFEVLFIVGSI